MQGPDGLAQMRARRPRAPGHPARACIMQAGSSRARANLGRGRGINEAYGDAGRHLLHVL